MWKILLPILAIGASIVTGLSFIGIGDWGSASIHDYHRANAIAVSEAMTKFSLANPVDFVVNTGDNFYYCGIQNITDPQINEDYTQIYKKMTMPWYSVLGNHDYGFNPQCQTELNKVIPNWVMDGRYYHRVIQSSTEKLHLIMLDTNPCVNAYRGTNKLKWDPCGSLYPICLPTKEPCHFHENIVQQDCSLQQKWFVDTMNTIPDDEWVVVVGHHRADQIDNQDFQTLLDSPKVKMYINGHVHILENYSVHGRVKYITTGAGSMVFSNAHIRNSNTIWEDSVSGFTYHTIENGEIRTKFVNADGKIIHQI